MTQAVPLMKFPRDVFFDQNLGPREEKIHSETERETKESKSGWWFHAYKGK